MKAVSLLLGALVSYVGLSAHAAPVKALDYVDLGRYAGTWYQIARNPVFFEAGCVCSRQVLTPDSSGQIAVYNSCNYMKPTGELKEIRGYAEASDASSNAKLDVSFNIPRTNWKIPWKGKYWVIAVDADYQWAVVTDPLRYSLYILARTPSMPDDQYQDALRQASLQVSTKNLRKTPQAGCTYPAGN